MIESPIQRPPHRQQGFGLIEVLVALTILSVGMLGLAAMQLKSLQASRESLNTTIATIMVRDMNERAWAQQDKACKVLLSKWQGDVAKVGGLPSPHGSWPDDVDDGLYGLKITWQGRGEQTGEDADPHVNLVAFLPCDPGAEDE